LKRHGEHDDDDELPPMTRILSAKLFRHGDRRRYYFRRRRLPGDNSYYRPRCWRTA
jgi:hypothetical protein